MSQAQSPQIDGLETALSILGLPQEKYDFIMEVIESLCEPNVNDNAKVSPSKFTTPDIVGFERSRSVSMLKLIEDTSVLRMGGYKLLPIEDACLLSCGECNCQTMVTMSYQKRNQPLDTLEYELCLSCYRAYKLTPVYASAEGEV